MKDLRSTIEFLTNYNKFAWNARYVVAKCLYEKIKDSTDQKEIKILYIEILSMLMASTEDLEAWFFFLRDRKKKDYDVWSFLMKYNSGPKSQSVFLKSVDGIKSFDDFVGFFDIDKDLILSSDSVTPEDVRNIVQTQIMRAIELSAKNRQSNDRRLVKVYNKVKHGFVVLDSSKDKGVVIRDRDDVLVVPVDVGEIEKLTETIQLMCFGIKGIIAILMKEVAVYLKGTTLNDEDKKYFLNKKITNEDDPISYLK